MSPSSASDFELHDQPVISRSSGKTVGAEALIRWRHPDEGLHAPGLFTPIAEESGLIDGLGRWVMTDGGNAAICSAVMALARGLGFQVIAEGVKDEAELAWREDKGCDLFQDFYFARPRPAEAFGQRLLPRAA